MQRIANPFTPVRLRSVPPAFAVNVREHMLREGCHAIAGKQRRRTKLASAWQATHASHSLTTQQLLSIPPFGSPVNKRASYRKPGKLNL